MAKDVKKYEPANIFEAVKMKFYSKSVEELVKYVVVLTAIIVLFIGITIYRTVTSGKISITEQCAIYSSAYEKSYLNYVAGEKVDNSNLNNSYIRMNCVSMYTKQVQPMEERYEAAIKNKTATAELEKKLAKFANVENVVKMESHKLQSLIQKCYK